MGARYDVVDKKCDRYEAQIADLSRAIGWINSVSHRSPDKHPGAIILIKARDRLQQRYLLFRQKEGIE